jgi:hypothetical protein
LFYYSADAKDSSGESVGGRKEKERKKRSTAREDLSFAFVVCFFIIH